MSDDRGKETNPRPENTETILCAFLRKGAACPLVIVCGRVVAAPRLDDVIGKNAYDIGEHCSKTVRHISKW